MTTNKPEVKAWIISAYVPYAGFQRHICMSEDDAHDSRATFERLKGAIKEVPLISLSDYEACMAVLFDGHSVYNAMTKKAKQHTSPESVAAVLDAAVKLMREVSDDNQ